MDCTIYVVKTKGLISCAVSVQLSCPFVFAYAKIKFSHDTVVGACCYIGPSTISHNKEFYIDMTKIIIL